MVPRSAVVEGIIDDRVRSRVRTRDALLGLGYAAGDIASCSLLISQEYVFL
jgi:hypothetical protein